MRIHKILEGEFEPAKGILRIDGMDNGNHAVSVEFAVSDRDAFLGWITTVLHEPDMSGDESTMGLLAEKITMATSSSPEHGSNVAFTFDFPNGGRMRVVLPIAAKSTSRLDAIQGHLEQALREMGAVEDPRTQ